MRKIYRREDLGAGVRGKHYAAYQRGTNLVLLQPDVAAVFPTSESVNDALKGLIKVARGAHGVGASSRAVKVKKAPARARARTAG
jgi:hypothetical protein